MGRAVEPGGGAESSDFAPVVVTQEVRGDAEEPRARVRSRGVEATTNIEGRGKGLGGEVVGQIRSNAAGEVAMDGVVVPIEDAREDKRFGSGSGDDLGV